MATAQESLLLLHKEKKTSIFHLIIVSSVATFFALILSVAYLSPNLIKIHLPDSSLSLSNKTNTSHDDNALLLQSLLQSHVLDIKNALEVAVHIQNQINDDQAEEQGSLQDCLELLDLSMDRTTDSVSALETNFTHHSLADAQAWLSSVLTNHETCFDGLSKKATFHHHMADLVSKAKSFLAILAQISPKQEQEETLNSLSSKLPNWVTLRDRMLLERSSTDIVADLVVAQDGTGDYKTITEAVAAAPNKSLNRFVIHVKEGVYEENVQVNKSKKNVMIVGDGMNSTIITGSLSVGDGTKTFNSATLAVLGDEFILQDIGILNTAGPEKGQALALRVGADLSVINRCLIDAYQDTLNAYSLRQFYRDCYITGTVDFIFGNAAVVFQSCQLVARRPMEGQANMVTAQGRTDPNQVTGTSIQNCSITASDDLKEVQSEFQTYLGRPWKNFSRVVIMESYIDNVIDPAGWSAWIGDFALNTCYYGEYFNEGPGAGLNQRVNWTGYHVINDSAVAKNFTVAKFIQGDEWLPSTGVDFIDGLVN